MSNQGPSIVFGGVEWGPDRYPILRIWENNSEMDEGRYLAFPLHRLVAYADGELDHPRMKDKDVDVVAVDEINEMEIVGTVEGDGKEVHHIDYDIWNADPENLEGMEPEDHGQETARAMADGGTV